MTASRPLPRRPPTPTLKAAHFPESSMRRTLPALAAVLALAAPGAAQLVPRPVPSIGVESFTFRSASMGVEFAVNVGLPVGYQPGAAKQYPALVSTDGDWVFPGVYDGVRSLGNQGVIPPMFVVSIGTSLDQGEELWTRRRVYEFSPDWGLQDEFGKVVAETCQKVHSEPGKCVGGQARFLNAIVTELIPLVAAKYPIDTGDLGLFGISAGGYFASWTIFQSSSPFKKYIISSPAMAYGDGDIFRQEARYAKEHRDLPVGIYFGAGTLEAREGFLEGVGRIVSGMSRISGLLDLRKYPSLRLVTEYHPGMSHGDVMGTVVVRGLRTLYGRPESPGAR